LISRKRVTYCSQKYRETQLCGSWLLSVRSSSPEERPRYQRVVLLPGERLGSNNSSTAAAATVPEGKTGLSEGAASPQVAKVPGFVMAKIKTPKAGKEDGEVTTDDEDEQTEADSQGRDTAAPAAEMTPPTVQKKGRRSSPSPSPIKRVPQHSTSMRRGEEDVEEEKLQKRLRNLERQKLDMAKHRKEEEEEERKKKVAAVRKEGESRVATVAPMPAVAADSETDLEKEIEDLEQKEESNSWLREQIEELRRELNDLKVGLNGYFLLYRLP
jgi:hypothetical protein